MAKTEKDPKNQELLVQENNILQYLGDNEHVIKSFGMQEHYVDEDNEIYWCQPYMVLEHARYGSLNELISFTKPFLEPSAYIIF